MANVLTGDEGLAAILTLRVLLREDEFVPDIRRGALVCMANVIGKIPADSGSLLERQRSVIVGLMTYGLEPMMGHEEESNFEETFLRALMILEDMLKQVPEQRSD